MPESEMSRTCKKCGSGVKQHFTYANSNGRMTIESYTTRCPVCKGFLKKPTPDEVRSLEMKPIYQRMNDIEERISELSALLEEVSQRVVMLEHAMNMLVRLWNRLKD